MDISGGHSDSEPAGPASRMAERPSEFLRLTICYLEGDLPAEELQSLQNFMRDDAANREAFVRLCRIYIGVVDEIKAEALLSQAGSDGALSGAVVMPRVRDENGANLAGPIADRMANVFASFTPAGGAWRGPNGRNRRHLGWIAFIATAALAAITVLTIRLLFTPPPRADNIVLSCIAAKWAAGRQINRGASVPAQGIELLHGLVEIHMQSGALLVVHGPARLTFPSARRVSLTHGSIVVRVPHTIAGFTVETNSASIVDLGTEFGVTAKPGTPTFTEVFAGHVAVRSTDNANRSLPPRILHQGQAVQISRQTIRVAAFEPLQFTRPAAFALRLRASASAGSSPGDQGYARWRATIYAISRMPDLRTYYTFTPDPVSNNILVNQSAATAGRYNGLLGHPGILNSSPAWTKGRWPAKTALKFSLTKHTAVHMSVGSHFVPTHAITIFVWLKPDDLGHTDHIINQVKPTDPRFNLCWLGSRETLYGPNAIYFDWGTGRVLSGPVLPKISKWTFLAVTARPDRSVRFYVDGKLVSIRPCPPGPKPHSMQLLIGAPGLVNSGTRRMYMKGRIGELAIFSRRLSSSEIFEIYRSGRPPVN